MLDNFDIDFLDEIRTRKETREKYENFFNRNLDIELSNTEARKQLRGIENYLELKESIEDEDIPKYRETFEMCEDGKYKSDKLLKMSKEESKDPTYLLKAHGFDVGEWQLINVRNNIWNVYSKQDGVQQLYSSKIVVKPFTPEFKEEWIKNILDKFEPDLCNFDFDSKYEFDKNGDTVEINLCDLHIGKYIIALLAKGEYNSDLAVKKVKEAIEKTISRISVHKIKEIKFIIGQDLLNFNDENGNTAKGTRQDMNEFFQLTYEKTGDMLLWAVETLRKICPVEVIYVKGNHDKTTGFSLADMLRRVYEFSKCKDVTVDSTLRKRKYRKIGNSLVGFGHGEQEKNRIYNCMQTDVPELWDSKFRFFHLSHIHSEQKKEIGGVIYEWLPSLSEECLWTYESGFVGAIHKIRVFVYDDEDGIIGEYPIVV